MTRFLALLVLAVINRLPSFMLYPIARLYIAGTTRDQAIALAHKLWREQRVYSVIDQLGEDPRDWQEVEAYHTEYRSLCLACSGLSYVALSAKLTGLGQRFNEATCYENARSLTQLAGCHGLTVRWDMEDHTTVESTLRIYRLLRGAFCDNTGIVLQSRLFRTIDDLHELMRLRGGASIRLCIGIYNEPATIALQDKQAMKLQLLTLLKEGWLAGLDIRVASHDVDVVRAALAIAREIGKPMSEVEAQMLYGVPDSGMQQEVQAAGARFRRYIPYGKNWRAYCLRRFRNNPDLVWYVIKNFFTMLRILVLQR